VFSILRSVYYADRPPARQERTGEFRRHRRVPARLGRGSPGRVRRPSAAGRTHYVRRSGALCANFRALREAVVLAHIGGFSSEIAQILHLPWAPSCHDCFGAADCSAPTSECPRPLGSSPMICDEYLSAIDPYLDGELPVIAVRSAASTSRGVRAAAAG